MTKDHFFQLHLNSVCQNTRQLSRTILPKSATLKQLSHMDRLIANMYVANLESKTLVIALDKSKWTQDSPYVKTFLSHDIMRPLLTFLHDNLWIRLTIGRPNQLSQIEPTPQFWQALNQIQYPQVEPVYQKQETVIIKRWITNTTWEPAPLPDSPIIKQSFDTLARLQILLSSSRLDIPSPASNSPFFFRLFDADETRGGRIYTYSTQYGAPSYQQLPKAERSKILINHEPTVELDFAALHPTIMIRRFHDAFQNPYLDNPQAKAYWVRAICAKSLAHAKISFVSAEAGTKTEFNKIDHQIESLFPLTHEYLSKTNREDWTWLQREDSDIMINIINNCIAKGIPALPVHDSIVVQESYQDEAKQIMIEAAKQVIGYEIDVRSNRH